MRGDTRFDRDTAVRATAPGRFEARIDRGWWIHRGPNGGYVAAVILRALEETVDDRARTARSLTVHFTAPPVDGAATLETSVERRGRSLTTVSGRLLQGSRLCAVATAAFSLPREGVEFQDPAMPEVVPPERARRLDPRSPHPLPIRERYDQRSVFPPADEGERDCVTGGWVRLAEPRVADAPLVAALTDAWPPAIMERLVRHGSFGAGVPTIDLTVHFRVTLPRPAEEPGGFHLCLFRTDVAREGFVEEDGEIWSADGRLVAQSRQLALLL